MRRLAIVMIAATLTSGVWLAFAPSASAHKGEEGVPAVTDVQEAIAILATHPSIFPTSDVVDHAMDKVKDAQEAKDPRGVDLDLVAKAQTALEAERFEEALTLLERSVGACPGAPVIDPATAPRTPPKLSAPCVTAAHLQALARSPVGGTEKPVLLGVAGVLVLGGILLHRRVAR